MSAPARARFVSLDMFRGATIFLMIVVNTAGPGAAPFAQLSHAPWFGFTLADLIFPTFLFAVGNAMSFALRPDMPAAAFLARVAKRAALIFLLGFLMFWYPFVAPGPDGGFVAKSLGDARIPGVLQRIALCYLLAAPIARCCSPRAVLVICAALLIGYWLILLGFSPAGQAYAPLGNIGTTIDITLFGRDHLYRKMDGFDPEGLLGTLPSTVNVLAGFLVGRRVQRAGKHARSVAGIAVAGAGSIALALLWSPWFPIGKRLWTGPFALLTIGIDMLLLAGFVWPIEMRGVAVGRRFLTILGRNPLAIYIFSELLVVTLQLVPVPRYGGLYDWIGIAVFQTIAPGPVGSLACAICYALVCWAFGWWLDRRGWLLKV